MVTKEKWKPYIDLALRHIEVGDDEQTRIEENAWEYLNGWNKEGVSLKDYNRLWSLIYKSLGVQREKLNFEKIHEVLKPYRSHKALYRKSFMEWEDKLFEHAR